MQITVQIPGGVDAGDLEGLVLVNEQCMRALKLMSDWSRLVWRYPRRWAGLASDISMSGLGRVSFKGAGGQPNHRQISVDITLENYRYCAKQYPLRKGLSHYQHYVICHRC